MTISSQFQSLVATDLTAIIPANGTTSQAMDLSGTVLVGIDMPAVFTGTSLAVWTLNIVTGLYAAAKDATGAAITIAVSAGTPIVLDPSIYAGLRFIQLVSNATENAQRTIGLVTRPV